MIKMMMMMMMMSNVLQTKGKYCNSTKETSFSLISQSDKPTEIHMCRECILFLRDACQPSVKTKACVQALHMAANDRCY